MAISALRVKSVGTLFKTGAFKKIKRRVAFETLILIAFSAIAAASVANSVFIEKLVGAFI